jgi:hypothetical protein
MSDHTQKPRTNTESTQNSERQAPTEYVERSDVGVSLTVKLTRGTGTRDQDKITAKVKAKTLEEARGGTSTTSPKTPARFNRGKATSSEQVRSISPL